MELGDLVGGLQVLVFLGLAVAAAVLARRDRGRPPAYLAGALGAMGVSLLLGLLAPEGGWPVPVTMGNVALLSGFPWLLAAFAWSFEGPLPRWLRGASVVVLALAAAFPLVAPFPEAGEPRSPGQHLYVAVFVLLWALLTLPMAVRLWRAGSRQRLVRARMRLLSAGALLLIAVLFVAVMFPTESGTLGMLVDLSILAVAVLFAAGVAPPAPLRLWWRRRATHDMQRMNAALISAADPSEVATAVVPLLADLVGGGVAVLDPAGDVVAAEGLSPETARRLAGADGDDDPLDARRDLIAVGDHTLLVTSTPYTPVFGAEERELVHIGALHLRLALERAELYRDAERGRRAAEDARRELESTLLGLAHDLKSPTLAISGFVGLLPHSEDPDERAEMIEHIQSSTAYLRQLVDALVEVSRVGRVDDDVVDVDLAATVDSVARRVRGTHPGATIQIEGPFATVRMNEVRAEQMIDNLVTNALKHGSREDLTITIAGGDDGEGVRLVVADDGQGIDPQDRERIFGLFQRGRTTGRGSGIGLGMVRRIAQSVGGSVELADTDHGATFVIRLPAGIVVDDGDGHDASPEAGATPTAPAAPAHDEPAGPSA